MSTLHTFTHATPATPVARWPALPDVLGPARTRRVFHRLKYRLLAWLTTPERRLLLQALDRHPAWARLLDADRRSFYVFYRRYLDRRYGLRQRFHAMIADLDTAAGHFGPALCGLLASGSSLRVAQAPGCAVDLTLNVPTRIEGYWALCLHDADARPLFNLSFGFTAVDTLLIASLQGLKRADGSNRETIRALTKQCHGLRPHALLLEVLRLLCVHWGVTRIVGIDSRNQVTQYKKKTDEFSFDYRTFWQEHGARLGDDGHWQIPLQGRRRSAEEMPMQKRAMYRRRYALLDTLAGQTARALRHPANHPGLPNMLRRPRPGDTEVPETMAA